MISSIKLLRKLSLSILLCWSQLAESQLLRSDTLVCYFNFNVHSISSGDNLLATKIKENYNGFKNLNSITLIGYTDTIGNELYNKLLAEKRLQSVKEILFKSFPQDSIKPLIKFNAIGEDKINNYSDAKKRRVEIIFSKEFLSLETGNSTQAPATSNNIDTIIQLDRIYFEPDLPILSQNSLGTLTSMLAFLNRYKNNFIEIKGHVNYTDSKLKESDPLYKLSVKRAKVIYEFLVDNGFSPENLKYYGVGNSQLYYEKPENLDQKQSNMRVELIIHGR